MLRRLAILEAQAREGAPQLGAPPVAFVPTVLPDQATLDSRVVAAVDNMGHHLVRTGQRDVCAICRVSKGIGFGKFDPCTGMSAMSSSGDDDESNLANSG